MKGKNPTRKQKEFIKSKRLVPNNWLILKAPTNELHIQNRASGKIRILK